jgi:hypothetical protein
MPLSVHWSIVGSSGVEWGFHPAQKPGEGAVQQISLRPGARPVGES